MDVGPMSGGRDMPWLVLAACISVLYVVYISCVGKALLFRLRNHIDNRGDTLH